MKQPSFYPLQPKEQTRNNYNHMANFYDLFSGSERKLCASGLAKLNIQPGETVLEVGFGTGHAISKLAASVGPEGKVCGLDLSEAMLNIAADRLKKAGLADRVDLCCGDAAALPYTDHTFDALFTSFTLEISDTMEIPHILSEFRRVLRNGGRFGLVAMSTAGKSTWILKLYEWAHRKFPRYIDCRPIDASRIVSETGFQVTDASLVSLAGLPVEIVIAKSIFEQQE
jgi:ubiquinone/menaquinone biosynthesis C-methylase UbiE